VTTHYLQAHSHMYGVSSMSGFFIGYGLTWSTTSGPVSMLQFIVSIVPWAKAIVTSSLVTEVQPRLLQLRAQRFNAGLSRYTELLTEYRPNNQFLTTLSRIMYTAYTFGACRASLWNVWALSFICKSVSIHSLGWPEVRVVWDRVTALGDWMTTYKRFIT